MVKKKMVMLLKGYVVPLDNNPLLFLECFTQVDHREIELVLVLSNSLGLNGCSDGAYSWFPFLFSTPPSAVPLLERGWMMQTCGCSSLKDRCVGVRDSAGASME